MTKGWFVGPFEPTAYATSAAEVAVKAYRAGDREAAHHHKIATELTVVVSGRIRMNQEEYSAGDIVLVEPFETVAFEAVTDAVTTVVKLPGARNDKYES